MTDLDFLTCEIARTRAEHRQTTRRFRGWLTLAMVLAVATGAAGAIESLLMQTVLGMWTAAAVWCAAVCARAADDDARILAWLS